MTAHECEFPEVLIGDRDDDGPLTAGMRVLTPCVCGETPFDEIDWLKAQIGEFINTIAQVRPVTPLYHWAPTTRRQQINKYGLRPYSRPTTSTYAAPVVCFADSPSWAWALSGNIRGTTPGDWDLWQTDLGRLTDPVILPAENRLSGIHEVRTEHRVYKRDVWLVGSRTKPSPRQEVTTAKEPNA